jgi:transporter family-2 protein
VSGNAGAILFTVVAGIAATIQAAINATLGRRIGTLEAAVFQTIVAMLIFAVLSLALRQGFGGVASALREPGWLWLGGVMGVIIVTALTLAPQRIGVVAFTGILIGGQFAMAAVVDRFGLLGVEKIGFTWQRVLGLALLAGGAALVLKR